MDSPLKQRLIGAAVLAALAIIFLPMLLKGPDVKAPDAAQVPLTMPGAPDGAFATHELPLGPDTHTPPGGVLGMDTAPAPKPDANAMPAPASSTINPAAASDVYPAVTPIPAPTPAAAPAAVPVATTAVTGTLTPAPMTAKPTTAVPAPPPTAAAPAATVPAATPTLAPDAAPPASNPSKVAAGNYAVNVGSFSNIGNANALVSRLKAAGLPVTSEKVKLNGSDALRVRIGPYADRAAAEAARLRAESMAGGSGKVIALDGDATTPAPAPAPVPAKVIPASKPASVTPTPAPVAPAVAPTSRPATTVTSGFAVQLAAPAEESAANSLRDRARAAGFAAFVQRVDTVDGPRFRVRAGPVADHNAAEVLRDSVNQKLGINGNIVAHP